VNGNGYWNIENLTTKRKPQTLLTLNNQTTLPETVCLARHNGLGGTMKIDKLAVRNTKGTGLFNTVRRKFNYA
jgi:hypothetical protein